MISSTRKSRLRNRTPVGRNADRSNLLVNTPQPANNSRQESAAPASDNTSEVAEQDESNAEIMDGIYAEYWSM